MIYSVEKDFACWRIDPLHRRACFEENKPVDHAIWLKKKWSIDLGEMPELIFDGLYLETHEKAPSYFSLNI